ncbi:hypothetical protein CR513_24255, partial [Mucuna pruriens]
MLVGEAISWRSAQQTLTDTSTMEVEFVPYFEATSHVIRKCVKEKKVVIEHISTELIIVNPLTKGMSSKNFKDQV